MATRVQSPIGMISRSDYMLMATEVSDRFGNWVRYTYDRANPLRLMRIEANDGRVVTLSYAQGRVATIFDGTRTWRYEYTAQNELQHVVRPDNSRWTFQLAPMVYGDTTLDDGAQHCDRPFAFTPLGDYIGTMTHPSGAVGRFTSRFLSHGRTNVERRCTTVWGTYATDGSVWLRSFTTQALVRKEVTGPGMAPQVWQYSGSSVTAGHWAPCTTCPDRKVVTVTEPDGSVTRHTFGIRWRENEGQLLKVEQGWDGASALRTTAYRYRGTASAQNFPDGFGDSVFLTSNYLSSRNRPIDQRKIFQQDREFTWEAHASRDGFNRFGLPTIVDLFSNLGYARRTHTVYHDNLARWVLGQVQSVTEPGSDKVPERHSYDLDKALPTNSWTFGRLAQTLDYWPDGTVRRRDEGAGRVTTYNNFMRGKPRQAVFADQTVADRGVDNLGNVSWITNEARTTHQFGYDAMGRLARIDYPTGDPVAYHPTQLRFEQVWSPDRGLGAGHWRRTITTGNAVTLRWFDAQWRVRLEARYDAADPGNTSSFVETRYDARGRMSFQSYPRRNIDLVDNPGTPGTRWTYDALDRVITQSADTELGTPAVTTTNYLSGFRKQVTNPRRFASTYSFQAFDTPSEEAIAGVAAPEGVNLSVSRDNFGKALAITRSGPGGGGTVSATRSYAYDQHERLCRTVEPEIGATVQGYDAASNVAWRASGLPASTGCDRASVPSNLQIVYGYDLRNRLTSTIFGDGSPGLTRSYTADGLPRTVASSELTWTYDYWNRRTLKSEWYSWPWQTPGQVWNFSWHSDAYGNVSSLSDPWGSLDYAPNALGQPTRAGGYASQVRYHPNGMPASYVLGNGIGHTLSQNLRGLPELWQDAGVGHDQYSYDLNGNVTAIADRQGVGQQRSMPLYDGLDRLRQANGPWGAGWFEYDALDNLRSSTVGTRSLTHHYDAANRLSALSGSVNLSVSYHANGNVLQRQGRFYGFDIGNRLRSVSGLAGYRYDGHGRRFYLARDDGSSRQSAYSLDGKLRFSWDSTKGHTRYIYLGGRLVAEHGETSVAYVHTDALGSPVARTNTVRAVLERTRYEPYGATVAGSTIPTGIGFTGHVNDADTGLVYMQQRYYEPLAGRFLSVDPVTTDAKTGEGFNRYVYGNNNPYRFKDPDGRWAEDLVLGLPSLAMGSASLVGNLRQGKFGAAAIDAIGMVADTAAIALPGVPGGAGLAIAGAAKEATTVIGRVKDLKALGPGEKSLLARLPNLGSPKGNWQQNSGVLREEIRLGKPIRDASPGDTAGQFLNAERGLLRDRGWTFDPKTNFWNPPTKP
jgi:RHS repeat-associated protein